MLQLLTSGEMDTKIREETEIFLINIEIIRVFYSQKPLPSISSLYYTFCML